MKRREWTDTTVSTRAKPQLQEELLADGQFPSTLERITWKLGSSNRLCREGGQGEGGVKGQPATSIFSKSYRR